MERHNNYHIRNMLISKLRTTEVQVDTLRYPLECMRPDEAGKSDGLKGNTSFDMRENVSHASATFRLLGRLEFSVLKTNKLLVPGVSIHIQLQQAKDVIRIMSPVVTDGAKPPRLVITDARLLMRRYRLREEIHRPLMAEWHRRGRITQYYMSEQVVGPGTMPTMSSHFNVSMGRCARPCAVAVCLIRTSAILVSAHPFHPIWHCRERATRATPVSIT